MEEKKSEEYIGDLISAGFRSAIVLIGFPYSEGSRLSYKKRGEELGPDSLRRFLHKVCTPNNGEYGIDISKTGICDYGNIIPPSGFPTIKRSYDKLGTKCRICVNRGNIPFIVGGTREFLYSSVGALLPDGNGDIPNIPGNYPHSPQSPSCVLIINPTLDLDEYLYDQTGNKSIHSLNTLTALFNSPGFTAKKCHSLLFGLADSNISPQHIQYIHNNNAKIITISDIRASPQRIFEDAKTEGEVTIVTQGGNYFRTLMDDLAEKYSQIYIAFSLESIMDGSAPGVSIHHEIKEDGMTSLEAAEIMYLAGSNSKVKIVDVTQFNPTVEDARTGRLLASLFYYFVMGVTIRLKTLPLTATQN